MKAFVLEKYGQPLRAVNMPIPEPGPRQVLVRMAASGVNHADERTRVGEFKAVFRLDWEHGPRPSRLTLMLSPMRPATYR